MAVTVSELFQDFAQDLERHIQEFDEHLENAADTKADVRSVDSQLAEASRCLTEAENSLRQMEMEAKSLPKEQRKELDPKLRQNKSDIADRSKAVGAAKSAANRRALLEEGDSSSKSRRDRARLLDVDDSLRRSSSKLEEAQILASETEQIGIDVMGDLLAQRETIQHTRANVNEIGDNVRQAKRMLGDMTRRAMANRLIMYCSVAALVFMVICGIYFGMQVEEEAQEVTVPGFHVVEHKTCAGASYTFDSSIGCTGWRDITVEDCQRKCEGNVKATNCPVQTCAAAVFYPVTGWCILFTEPECVAMRSQDDSNTFLATHLADRIA